MKEVGWFACVLRGAGVDTRAFNGAWGLLTVAERRNAFVLLGLIVVGAVMETLGIGLMLPAIAMLTQSELSTSYQIPVSIIFLISDLPQPHEWRRQGWEW